MAGRAERRRRRTVRDAAAQERARPSYRDARRTRLQQLAARRGPRECGRLAEGRARAARLADRHAARACAVPAGGALAVDRERFGAHVEARLAAHPRVRIVRDEITAIPLDRPAIVACGPLPSPALSDAIDALVGRPSGCTTTMQPRRSSPPIRSTWRRCTPSRATTRARVTTTSIFRSMEHIRGVRARSARVSQTRAQGFRADVARSNSLLRRLFADRGDGGSR